MSGCSSLIDSKLGARQSAGDANRQGLVALDEARIYPLGLADHLNLVEPLQDFFPDYLQLKLGQSEPNAAMNAEAEGDVGTRPGTVNDEVVRTLDYLVVAVARDVPHHDLVTFLDLPAADLEVLERGPSHMRQWRLPADHLRHETVDQRRIRPQLAVLIRIPVQRIDAARQCVAGGIVAADDQQDQVAEEILRVHVSRGFAVNHHRQQIALRRLIDALFPELAEIRRAFQQ